MNMKFGYEIWKVGYLLQLYRDKMLDLNPKYQRNAIWSSGAQKRLIESVYLNYPLPTFFLLEKEGGSYEMVDGQQRTRAFLSYLDLEEFSFSKALDDEIRTTILPNFPLSIAVISELKLGTYIEEFYDRVNSSGLRLNRPEQIKARHHDSKLLRLATDVTENPKFLTLQLIAPTSSKRMLDRDLAEELIALMHSGITDKKKEVNNLYDEDLTKPEVKTIGSKFENLLDILVKLNLKAPIKDTRFKQRNDIYTLVSFILQNQSLGEEFLEAAYLSLVAFQDFISPSSTSCQPFRRYALHCVSQSNQKSAREERLAVLNGLFLNEASTPNAVQQELLTCLQIKKIELRKVGRNYILPESMIVEALKKR